MKKLVITLGVFLIGCIISIVIAKISLKEITAETTKESKYELCVKNCNFVDSAKIHSDSTETIVSFYKNGKQVGLDYHLNDPNNRVSLEELFEDLSKIVPTRYGGSSLHKNNLHFVDCSS